MQWTGRRQSANVDDRRRMTGGKKVAFGGGIVGIIIVAAIYLLGGGNSSDIFNAIQQQSGTSQSSDVPVDPAEDEMAQFVAVVLADNEDVWHKIFSESGKTYEEPVLVLYRDYTESGCGSASASTGPFYCPGDHKVYMDLSFFEELTSRFGAKEGDFAVAYVVSHEIGHHVQTLLGISPRVRERMQEVSEKEANALSVAMELQADFLAGVWAYHTDRYKGVLEAGDIEEALSAASAVGDDRIQKQAQGYTVPDSFTHGTSEQRMYWFKRGYASGDLRDGNTFAEMGLSL